MGAARPLLLIALVGVVMRLAFGFGYWSDQPMTRDEHEYLSLARSLTAGHGFTYDAILTKDGAEPFGRAPGYPAFLALVGGGRAPADAVPAAVKVAQSLVGGLGVLMVGVIAYRLGGRRGALLAAAGAAVYPPLVWIAGYALSEALFWPVGLLCAWSFDRAVRSRTPSDALLCGLALGVGTLIRPALVLFLPLAALYLLSRRQLATAVLVVTGLLVVVGPWTVRNYFHHGRLVFVASEGGVTFWTGNHPLATGDGDMAANIAIKRDNQRLRDQYPAIGEEDMEPIYYREAFAWIRQHPVDWLTLQARKVFYLVVPVGPSYTLHSTRYYVASVASYLTVLGLALATLPRLRQTLASVPGLWILAASALLVALAFFPQERFRIPIIDPVLVMLAGAGLASARQVRHA
jgi:4-amino-4-deoxy-L-arabinose transferase-like glycosyltransferase